MLRSVGVAALLSTGVAACSGSPTSPSPAPAPGGGTTPPPARTETRYDFDVTVRYIDISPVEACDGRVPLINSVNEGEFQFRIDALGSTKTEFLETDNYYDVLGENYKRGPGERINFTNRRWSFADLKDGDGVRVRLRGTEWDANFRDSDMNDLTDTTTWTMTSSMTSRTDQRLSIGSNDCGMTLVYDLTVATRQIPM
jgi:hypothetical protein